MLALDKIAPNAILRNCGSKALFHAVPFAVSPVGLKANAGYNKPMDTNMSHSVFNRSGDSHPVKQK
ncbi:MAG: hypothetical protein WA830_02405 [Candidatus Sulfotelmatobacter sp.]